MRYLILSALCLLSLAVYAEAKPVDGFGPKVDNEPVLVSPLSDQISNIDEDLIDRLRSRIRLLDEDIAEKLDEHEGRRPRQYVQMDMPELKEERSLRDMQWQAFMEAVRGMNSKQQQQDILDKPSQPQVGRQEKMLMALNTLEAAECYRELNQQGEANLDDIRKSASLAKNIVLEDLPAADQARLLYLRCVLALDRSRWEAPAKRDAFLKQANDAYQLLKASHPNSLLTANAAHLLDERQAPAEGDS